MSNMFADKFSGYGVELKSVLKMKPKKHCERLKTGTWGVGYFLFDGLQHLTYSEATKEARRTWRDHYDKYVELDKFKKTAEKLFLSLQNNLD